MITVAILTVSDSAAAGTRRDESGPALRVECEEAGWRVMETAIVPDNVESIREKLQKWSDAQTAQLLLTTGGTGIAQRDVTPEATRPLLDKELEGLGELMRREGEAQTPFAVLSRSLAGTRGRSLIVNLPGSPKGAVHSLHTIRHLVVHIAQLLSGNTEHQPA